MLSVDYYLFRGYEEENGEVELIWRRPREESYPLLKTARGVALFLFLILFTSQALAGYDPWTEWQRAKDIEVTDPASAESLYRRATF